MMHAAAALPRPVNDNGPAKVELLLFCTTCSKCHFVVIHRAGFNFIECASCSRDYTDQVFRNE